MLTRNFDNLMRVMPQSSATVRGLLPATDVYGMQYFLTPQYPAYPYSRTATYTTDRYAAGITFGSGTTAPTKRDIQLESPITSGLNVAITATRLSVNDGEPYLEYALTVTNTTSADITLSEICYKQQASATPYSNATTAANYVFMMDRTLIEPAVRLEAKKAVVIDYRLMTESTEVTVNGVKVVSWQYGSDDDVAAMIDAAHAGTIDLSDYWSVGDMRPCQIDAFTAGGNVSHSAQTIDLVITSFDEYNGSGSVMQVDFAESLATKGRMHSTATNNIGYGGTEMCTTTLPALAEAMPSWLQDRMLTFDVLVSEGNQSSEIVTASGNKLALRSEIEARNNYSNSYEGEGVAIDWYKPANKIRQKRNGRSGSNEFWWFRSPKKSNASQFAGMKADGSGQDSDSANKAWCIAPFMCL